MVLAVINALFLLSFVSSPAALAPLLLFVLVGYFFIHLLDQNPGPGKLAISIAAIIGAFVYLKKYTLIKAFPALPFDYTLIGLSYILFRVIHLMIDVNDRNIVGKVRGLDYFNYVFLMFNFVSGPIQRYQDFHQQQSQIFLYL